MPVPVVKVRLCPTAGTTIQAQAPPTLLGMGVPHRPMRGSYAMNGWMYDMSNDPYGITAFHFGSKETAFNNLR